jgi:hypothetical protein
LTLWGRIDEILAKKFKFKKGVIYLANEVYSGYNFIAYFNPYKNAANSKDWENAIKKVNNKYNIHLEYIVTDMAPAIKNIHLNFRCKYHLADHWHVFDKLKKVANGVKTKLKTAAKTLNEANKFYNENYDSSMMNLEDEQILFINHISQLNQNYNNLKKTHEHIVAVIDMFYSCILRPTMANPYRLRISYDQLIAFLEEVTPVYQVQTFLDAITYLKNNKSSILAFTDYIQDKLTEIAEKMKVDKVIMHDLWLTIAIRQFSNKDSMRLMINDYLHKAYAPEVLKTMFDKTYHLIKNLKTTSQMSEGYNQSFEQHVKPLKDLNNTEANAIAFFENHKLLANSNIKFRQDKSRRELLTKEKHQPWLDMVVGEKAKAIRVVATSQDIAIDTLHKIAA